MLTGPTSVISGTYPSNHKAGADKGEVAIAGKRVALITRFVSGNSYDTTERLHRAARRVGARAEAGAPLREIAPTSAREIALSGRRLVVLTETKTIEVYDWTTGALVHTWPVAATTPNKLPGHLAVYGKLAVYAVDPRYAAPRQLHLLDLT